MESWDMIYTSTVTQRIEIVKGDHMDLKALRISAGLTVKEMLQDYPDKRLDKYTYSKIEAGIVSAPQMLLNHVVGLLESNGRGTPAEAHTVRKTPVATAENIIQYIPTSSINGITRRELVSITGLSDRIVRKRIEALRREYPILNHQNGRGYFISYDPAEVRSYYRQEQNRALSILYRLKPIRKILKGAGNER